MGFVEWVLEHDSLSHDGLLRVVLGLQNLHISFRSLFP